MTDHLAEWISERPALINTLRGNEKLEHLLRSSRPARVSTPEMEEKWKAIVDLLQK